MFKLKANIQAILKRENQSRLYLKSQNTDIFPNVHGILHLTGARPKPSKQEKNILKTVFKK